MSKFQLPDLPYPRDALEPFISSRTLELHHGTHHQGYVDKTNSLIKGTGLEEADLVEIVIQTHGQNEALFNNAAQHFNHSHFWRWMNPGGGGAIPGKLEVEIIRTFGGVNDFKSKFVEAGTGQFGSGWVWLSWQNDKLDITSTPNGENPLIDGARPLLGCDVWEHSYYLDYQSNRGEYIEKFLNNLVNWEVVLELYENCE